jgi:hypothetical protein
LPATHFALSPAGQDARKTARQGQEQNMRSLVAVAALAAALGACQPNSEKTNPAVTTDESAAERMQGAPAKGANSFTQEQARERAVSAGYTDVGALTQAADGTWQGPAMQTGASVNVVIDYQGNVTTSGAAMAPNSMTTPGATPGATSATPQSN